MLVKIASKSLESFLSFAGAKNGLAFPVSYSRLKIGPDLILNIVVSRVKISRT